MGLWEANVLTWAHSVSSSPSSLHIPPIPHTASTSTAGEITVSITEATGFTDGKLVQRLHADKHTIHVLTRSRSKAEAIFPGKKIKKEIKQSRLKVTSKVVEYIQGAPEEVRPSVLVTQQLLDIMVIFQPKSLSFSLASSTLLLSSIMLLEMLSSILTPAILL